MRNFLVYTRENPSKEYKELIDEYKNLHENGNKNIKNYYYMMNPNVIPFIDAECEQMRDDNHVRFLQLIKENIKWNYHKELV